MIRNDRSTESGSTLVVSALLLVAILGAAALGIDVGVFYTARAQSQNAADSGALACAGHMLTFTQLNNGAIPQLKAKGVEYSNYHSILTDAVTQGGPGTAAAMGLTYDQLIDDVFRANTLTGELNTVEQVAEFSVLLASDLGGGFTGALLSLDGGISPW